MNYKMIRFVISWVLKVEGMLMLLPALVGAMYQEKAGFAYLIWGLLCVAAGLILCLENRPIWKSIPATDLSAFR